jgi:hypothetical protein
MSVDERERHRLYNRAVEVLGEEEATILMAHLPPGGWSNLATKQDLLELEERLKGHTFRTILVSNLTMALVVAGIALTAVRAA